MRRVQKTGPAWGLYSLMGLSFVGINLLYFLVFPIHFNVVAVILRLAVEVLIVGFSYDVAVLALGLVYWPSGSRRLDTLPECPKVALLYCTCDDVDEQSLRELERLTYSELDIYVLDDSGRADLQALIDESPYRVVRRGTRKGFKAGNLNNWLRCFGQEYEFFIIADADSRFPADFVQQMMRHAMHPANDKVAFFESAILPHNNESAFARIQSASAITGNALRESVENRYRMVLSVGHNNLCRTDPILKCGGFCEDYIAEDYATSIRMLQMGGWMCTAVPVVSYERVPANTAEYVRRQSRWAYQTMQLVSLQVTGLSFAIWLRILRSVLYYLEPVVVTGVLMLMCVALPWKSGQSESFAFSTLEWVGIIAMPSVYIVLPLILRVTHALREGIAIADVLKCFTLYGALFAISSWPISKRLIALVLRARPEFTVTGRTGSPSLLQITRAAWPALVIHWVALAACIASSPFISLVLPWIALLAASPIIACHYQRVDAAA